MALKVPCLRCGEPTTGSRCDTCQPIKAPRTEAQRAKPNHDRGYNHAWKRLSRMARRLQPFCSDCGDTNNLQGDHTPEAWARHEAGLPIRLQDIDVVCGPCNIQRGPARGPTSRSKRSETPNHTHTPESTQQAATERSRGWGDTPNDPTSPPMSPKGVDDYTPGGAR